MTYNKPFAILLSMEVTEPDENTQDYEGDFAYQSAKELNGEV